MKKKIFIAVLVLMILTLAGISIYYWYNNAYYVSTEDARVDADLVKVSPRVSGKIVEINVESGDRVEKGRVLARLDDLSLPAGSNLDLTLLRSPIDGMVVYVPAHEGEVGVPGQPAVMLVDTSDLYITANIEETDLHRVRPGQRVDVTIDSIPGHVFTGRVDSILGASLSTFSLLPSNNTSGNFTKVVQRVPVTIELDSYDGYRLVVGTNAVVRIHVR